MKRRSLKASSIASRKGRRTHKRMKLSRKQIAKLRQDWDAANKGTAVILPTRVILPPKVYDDAKRAGLDMRGYVKAKRIPREGLVRLARPPAVTYRGDPN